MSSWYSSLLKTGGKVSLIQPSDWNTQISTAFRGLRSNNDITSPPYFPDFPGTNLQSHQRCGSDESSVSPGPAQQYSPEISSYTWPGPHTGSCTPPPPGSVWWRAPSRPCRSSPRPPPPHRGRQRQRSEPAGSRQQSSSSSGQAGGVSQSHNTSPFIPAVCGNK